jgi:hypothetical protein
VVSVLGARLVSLAVLSSLAVNISGCEASAQDPLLTAPPAPTLDQALTAAQRRALATRAKLFAEGVIRDGSAVVLSSRCTGEEEHLFGLASAPLCDELEIKSLGTTYRAYLFSKAHDVLVVVHEGHKPCAHTRGLIDSILPDAVTMIERLLDHADVLYVDMPMLGVNCGQEFKIKDIAYTGYMHNWFEFVDQPTQSALAYFFDPIFRALDFVSARYRTIHMTGRSGGGWATTVYAALDWRISRSVSVAGSLPIELRTPQLDGVDDIGDWEQYAAHVYRLISYQELYEAAGGLDDSRRHVQIYNEFDICCFRGAKGLAAAAAYASSSHGYLSERVRFLVNAGEREHTFPVEMVIDQLFGP